MSVVGTAKKERIVGKQDLSPGDVAQGVEKLSPVVIGQSFITR